MSAVAVIADGVSWPLETFIGAYRYVRVPEDPLPSGWVFSVLLPDGSIVERAYGYEIPGLRALAISYVDGGSKTEAFDYCGRCGCLAPLDKGGCEVCRHGDDDDDDDDYCPHCGRGG